MAILATGVTKVSGKAADTSGEVVLTAADVGAVPTKEAIIRLDDGIVSGWPNNTNGSPDNYINRSIIRLSDTHGTLSFFGDDTTSSYRLGVQSSNPSPNFTSVVGTFELNPYGGAVKINGYNAYHSGNVVGSGGIIERGSNANGEYVKFADGTLIMWGIKSTPIVIGTAIGSVFRSGAIAYDFPTNLLTTSSATVKTNCAGSKVEILTATHHFNSTSQAVAYFLAPTSIPEATYPISFFVAGRWK